MQKVRKKAEQSKENLGHNISKQSAEVSQINTELTIAPQREISTGGQQEHITGLGIGL
jgi:hypothetical protein